MERSGVCLEPEEALAYVGGNAASQRTAVERHLDRCPDCREWVAQLALTEKDGGVREHGAVRRPPPSALSPSTEPGELRIGRYVIVAMVGRGAMGRVLRAYDPNLAREVAIKVLGTDRIGEIDEKRVIAEARAMAKLSHPNVAAVYDVEQVAPARLALVMEYVAGTDLRVWLGAQARPWPDILRCFVAAGRGLAAAHERGLLHRDFKPANVLVGADGARVKVTDFGLAKMLDRTSGAPRTEPGAAAWAITGPGGVDVDGSPTSPPLTRTGRTVGTPMYMAPEQHRGRGLTAAADQYGFCVALWEALAGELPFSGRDLVARKHAGPPTWSGPPIPQAIVRALVRGLAPDPADRWPSMNALLAALIRAPGRRRIGAGLGMLGATVAGVLVFGVQGWVSARAERCSGAAQQLAAVWNPVRRVQVNDAMGKIEADYVAPVMARTIGEIDRYSAAWARAYTDACEATAVRAEQSSEVLDLRMACLQRAKRELGATVGVLASADAEVVRGAHELVAGLAPLERCSDRSALSAEAEPWSGPDAPRVEAIRVRLAAAKAEMDAGRYGVARAELDAAKQGLGGLALGPVRAEVALMEGSVLEKLGEYGPAGQALRRALRLACAGRRDHEMRLAALGLMSVLGRRQQRFSEALSYREVAAGLGRGDGAQEADLRHVVGDILRLQGDYDGAEAQLRAVVATREASYDSGHPKVVDARHSLAANRLQRGDHEGAEAEFRRLLATVEHVLGPGHPRAAIARDNLASALSARGNLVQAELEHRRALAVAQQAVGPDHPDIASTRNNLGAVLHDQGKYDEAEVEYREALALRERTLGPRHPKIAQSRNNLGALLADAGRYAEAAAELRQALASQESALGPEHPSVASTRNNLAAALIDQGDVVAAEPEIRQVIGVWERSYGPNDARVAGARHNLALALAGQGRHAQAEAEFRRLIALQERLGRAEHADAALSRSELAAVLFAQGNDAEAEREHRRALVLFEKALGPDHPLVTTSQVNLAAVLYARGRYQGALPLAEQAWARRRQADNPGDRAKSAFLLARLLWTTSRRPASRQRAVALATQALAAYGAPEASGDDGGVEVGRWLAARGHRR